MERVFDELIGLHRAQSRWHWRPAALRIAGNLLTGLTIGVGIAVGHILVG